MRDFINRVTESFKSKREKRKQEAEAQTQAKATVTDPNHIQVTGEFPKAGSIFKWIEPVCITVGRVISVQPDRIEFSAFRSNVNEDEKFELYMQDGKLFYKSAQTDHEIPVDAVKRQFEFYITATDKNTVLQDMIDYQVSVVIPQKEKELIYFKERLDLFVSLKEC